MRCWGDAAVDSCAVETPFDRVTALAAALFSAPISTISTAVGDDNVFHSTRGMSLSGAPCQHCLSQHVLALGHNGALMIEDTLVDERTRCNQFVVGEPHVRFYAGAVITTSDGRDLGTICVLDVVARPRPSDDMMDSLRMLARIAADIFDQLELTRLQLERLETQRLLGSLANVGIWRWDIDTNVVTCSEECSHIYGVDPENSRPTVESALAAYRPKDQATLKRAINHSRATGEGYELRLRMTRADGEERLVHAKAECQTDETGRVTVMFGVFRDVTEAEHSIERIQRSEGRYRLLAEHSSDIITTTRLDGIFTYVSPVIEAALGYRPEELVGRPYTEFVHPDDLPEMKAALIDYVGAGPSAPSPRIVWRTFKKNGEMVWFEGHPRLTWDANGRPLEIQDLLRDVTETKRLEADLVEARDRAEGAARAKSEFLANMSHELRTPLTSVIGFSGLLQASEALPASERRHADQIASASKALLAVINNILDYSKLEAGAVDIENRPFDPREMTESVTAMLEIQCVGKGLRLDVEIDPSVPAALTGDEALLRQVLLNFLANAVKFTPSGGVRVTVGGGPGSAGGWRLRASVADTGIGVPPGVINQLFERFSQADSSTTRVYGGTGLGLAISRRLIEVMGGEIGAESKLGEGSTFWFEVPLTSAEAIAGARPDVTAAPSPEGLRILMADDAAPNRELVAAILGGMGVALETVEDGAQAVEAVRYGDYDLVLMDVHMPIMDGLDATRAIRALGGAVGRTPIIALTANIQPDQVERCRQAGMDDHVGKPIQVPALLRAIAARLEQRVEAGDSAAA